MRAMELLYDLFPGLAPANRAPSKEDLRREAQQAREQKAACRADFQSALKEARNGRPKSQTLGDVRDRLEDEDQLFEKAFGDG